MIEHKKKMQTFFNIFQSWTKTKASGIRFQMNSTETSPVLTLESLQKFQKDRVVKKFSHDKKTSDESDTNNSFNNERVHIRRKIVKKRIVSSSDEDSCKNKKPGISKEEMYVLAVSA